MPSVLKQCSRCHRDLSRVDGFYWWKGRPKGECKDCTKLLARQQNTKRDRSSPAVRASRRRRYYEHKAHAEDGRTEASFFQKFRRHGLTLDQYHALVERQDFCCAICGNEPPPQNGRRGNVDNFVIDHDHQTGRVRALLCWPCNAALGNLRDEPEVARKITEYLVTHHARRVAPAS